MEKKRKSVLPINYEMGCGVTKENSFNQSFKKSLLQTGKFKNLLRL